MNKMLFLKVLIQISFVIKQTSEFKPIDEEFNVVKQYQPPNRNSNLDFLFNQLVKKYNQDQSNNSSSSSNLIFQPKSIDQTEGDDESDYQIGEIEDYYDYSSADYHLIDSNLVKKPSFFNSSTHSPKWIVKNSTQPSKFNLNSIFEFVEFVLRPTNQNENTIEYKFNLNEHDYLNNSDYYYFDDSDDYTSNVNGSLNIKKNISNTTVLAINTTTTTTMLAFNYSSTKAVRNESSSFPWYSKENVCMSKMTYQRESKTPYEYWYISGCKNKIDSEFCVTNIQAGSRAFEIRSTIFCCPNHHLNLTLDACIPSNHSMNLFEELKSNLIELNSTVSKYIYDKNETNNKHNHIEYLRKEDDIIHSFYTNEFNQLYNDLINNQTRTKYTIYLWDNNRFLDYVTSVMNYHDYDLKQKLEKIILTLKNHLVKQHHMTQSIVSNQMELETLANKHVRLSKINGENRSFEFVNCKELKYQNQYYKPLASKSQQFDYHLLIHKLQTGSLLIPFSKTVYQVLTDKILRSTSSISNQYKIFQQIFTKSSEKLSKDLNTHASSVHSTKLKSQNLASASAAAVPGVPNTQSSSSSSSSSSSNHISNLQQHTPITIFVPTDQAFSQLRQDQINSLISDPKCGYKFLTSNIVFEEVCPNQLMKYNTEYSSPNQRANFIPVNENNNSTNILYFNGQIVNLSKSYINSASNGMIYRLNTIKLSGGVVDFLYDIVISLKKKFPISFLESLNPTNWIDIIKNESTNTTLFMPFDDKHQSTLSNNRTLIPINHYDNNTNLSNEIYELIKSNLSHSAINIYDLIFKGRFSIYELNNGDLLESISGKKFLITAYAFEANIPEFMSFIPARNFQRKSINCQQLEMPDLSACSSQLIIYKSGQNSNSNNYMIPYLNDENLLDYISIDPELNLFKNLLDICGPECKLLYENVQNQSYTILVPTNDYFSKHANNFNKFSNNIILLKKTILSNIFYGTNCMFYLKMNVVIENLLNRKIKSKNVYSRIQKAQAYLSKNGLLVHKSFLF